MLSPGQALCSRAVSAGSVFRNGTLVARRAQTFGLRGSHFSPVRYRQAYSTSLTEPVTTIQDPVLPLQDEDSRGPGSSTPVARTISTGKVQTIPLPVSCPGCGALSQETIPDEAGFYSRTRRAVRQFLKRSGTGVEQTHTFSADIDQTDMSRSAASALSAAVQDLGTPLPVCDRCHDLVYNAKGHSIAHPSLENIADSIAESPFDRNHIYHVLDAADFPMSLISNIFDKLELVRPRSQNRRSKHRFPYKPTISFVITRSDLLGATKEDVDRMMPYFQKVLRNALGRSGQDMRLGDVHLVSSKRGWWTKEIKDGIWERGGGNWMVGRVNVGKSNLFEVIFPKGSGDRAPKYAELQEKQDRDLDAQKSKLSSNVLLENSLLPPAQPEVPFPAMPIVSNLPGTTASPIRLPFGNHKGELIDLPGIARGNLEDHVLPSNKLDLVMQARPTIEQYVIKPGQSLLLGGGLIRITPQFDENTTVLAYPFVPIDAHVTATEKAIGAQTQQRQSGIRSILAEQASATMSSAGIWNLSSDVTKSRAGPLMRAGLPADKLLFRVYSTDILIEGVGWIELVCQVRRRRPGTANSSSSTSDLPEGLPPPIDPASNGVADSPVMPAMSSFDPFSSASQEKSLAPSPQVVQTDASGQFLIPRVEIFSPNGKHISQREPLQAWLLWEDRAKQLKKGVTSMRPRKSMKGVKKQEKKQRHEQNGV